MDRRDALKAGLVGAGGLAAAGLLPHENAVAMVEKLHKRPLTSVNLTAIETWYNSLTSRSTQISKTPLIRSSITGSRPSTPF